MPATRLSDRLAVVKSESEIDYRHFRLGGTRDYALPPERCVEIDSDGVTLTIDQGRSDLLVETELRRFARFLDQPGNNGQRQYHVTSSSLAVGQNAPGAASPAPIEGDTFALWLRAEEHLD